MARFRLFLVGTSESLDVECWAKDLAELERELKCQRFLRGRISEPDGNGECKAVLIPAGRIQLIVEN